MIFPLLIISFLVQITFATETVNDVSQINPISMDKVFTPKSVEDIQKIIKASKGPISIGGGRFSMGGQTAIDNGIQIDMRQMNKIIHLDKKLKKITVQAGIRWRDIQDLIDPHNLSMKIMQTYSNFTVGGSLSVNAHGRYVGQGPIIRSVDSIKLVLADGKVIHASSAVNSDYFHAAIGGYGGIGVIAEATIQLVDNIKIKRSSEIVTTKDYPDYFFKNIRNNSKAILHNGDLYPPDYIKINAVNWTETEEPVTVSERLIPKDQKYWLQPRVVSVISSLPNGTEIRASVIDPLVYKKKVIVWKNYEASYDVAELEPTDRSKETYVLQEYFIPISNFGTFIPKMREVFKKHRVNVINVSIRHALPDKNSLLSWAPDEVFCFVIYIKQAVTTDAKAKAETWTREMQDQILSERGRWYLPYQIHATKEQFVKAYPGFEKFAEFKKKYDPEYRFKNKLWEKYYTGIR